MERIVQPAVQRAEAAPRSAAASHLAAAVGAALLGVALIFVSGFAQIEAIHNGTHDARHSANFPCH